VVNTCEKYFIKEDRWEKISNLKESRYAATAIGCS
jgi:hypothetical protein